MAGGRSRLVAASTARSSPTRSGSTSRSCARRCRAGQSIADVAAAQGVDVQVVIDAMVAEAEGTPRRGGRRTAASRRSRRTPDWPVSTDRITEHVNQAGGFGRAAVARATCTASRRRGGHRRRIETTIGRLIHRSSDPRPRRRPRGGLCLSLRHQPARPFGPGAPGSAGRTIVLQGESDGRGKGSRHGGRVEGSERWSSGRHQPGVG